MARGSKEVSEHGERKFQAVKRLLREGRHNEFRARAAWFKTTAGGKHDATEAFFLALKEFPPDGEA